MNKLVAGQKKMVIGSKEYVASGKKIGGLKRIMTEYRHDTITYTDTITEFVRDSTGVWQPTKKRVSAGKATGAGITTGEKTDKERRFSIKSTDMQGATYSKEVKRTSFWWYLICLVGGIVLGIAGVAAVRYYFISRR